MNYFPGLLSLRNYIPLLSQLSPAAPCWESRNLHHPNQRGAHCGYLFLHLPYSPTCWWPVPVMLTVCPWQWSLVWKMSWTSAGHLSLTLLGLSWLHCLWCKNWPALPGGDESSRYNEDIRQLGLSHNETTKVPMTQLFNDTAMLSGFI